MKSKAQQTRERFHNDSQSQNTNPIVGDGGGGGGGGSMSGGGCRRVVAIAILSSR